jgi:hypothetical protein
MHDIGFRNRPGVLRTVSTVRTTFTMPDLRLRRVRPVIAA